MMLPTVLKASSWFYLFWVTCFNKWVCHKWADHFSSKMESPNHFVNPCKNLNLDKTMLFFNALMVNIVLLGTLNGYLTNERVVFNPKWKSQTIFWIWKPQFEEHIILFQGINHICLLSIIGYLVHNWVICNSKWNHKIYSNEKLFNLGRAWWFFKAFTMLCWWFFGDPLFL